MGDSKVKFRQSETNCIGLIQIIKICAVKHSLKTGRQTKETAGRRLSFGTMQSQSECHHLSHE